MKKTFYFNPIFIILILIISVSCSTDNDIYEESNLNDVLKGKIWNCISVKEKNTNNPVSTCVSDDSFEFLEDNVCNLYAGNVICDIDQLFVTPGTYEITDNDNYLEITFNGFMIFEYDVYDFSDEELILEHTIDGKEVLSRFEPEI